MSKCAVQEVVKKRSRFRGVYWKQNRNRKKTLPGIWCAQLKSKGQHYFLGHFEFEVDAAMAYDEAALRIFGSDAKVNFYDQAEAFAAKAKALEEQAAALTEQAALAEERAAKLRS
jgi:AP2 domain